MDARMWNVEGSAPGTMVMRGVAACLRGIAALACIVRRRPGDSLVSLAALGATGAILVNALFLQTAPHPAPILPVKPRPVALSEITNSLPLAAARPRQTETTAPKAEPLAREALAREARAPEARATETRATETRAPETRSPGAPAVRTRQQIVSDIQRELSRRGFFDAPVDGVYGPRTDAAIRDFEHAAGIKGNSQPDDALLRLIARSTARASPPPAAVPVPAAVPAPATVSAAVPRPPAEIRSAPKAAAPGKRILSVQRALSDFGYGQLAPTGVLGAETKSAIERFERERKLPVTGQISDRLVRELAAVTGRPLE
jgi:peptidoglycan hydrolase-like protein with peptidoglycan-binding domain